MLSEDDLWRRVDPADRARQFMPFAALRGYYDLVREREHIPEPRRMMTEEHALELSQVLGSVGKGSMVSVTYYDGDAYVTLEGMVVQVDEVFRTLNVVKLRIPFDDIWSIERLR